MQQVNDTDQTSESSNGSRDKGERLTKRDVIGGASLIIVVAGALSGYYAFNYISKDSARMQFWIGFMFSFAALVIVVIQVAIYWQQASFMDKQARTMDAALNQTKRALEMTERAHVEVHSIETNDIGTVAVRIENIGRLPATDIEVACTIYGMKGREKYKPDRFSMKYGQLARGNMKIHFTFSLGMFFSNTEVLVILGEGYELPIFVEFRLHYFDGFQKRVSDSSFGYLGKPRNEWLAIADINWSSLDAKFQATTKEQQANKE